MIDNKLHLPSCPIKGSLVTLFDGTSRKIEDLLPGDKLMSAKIDTYVDSDTAEIYSWSNNVLNVTTISGEVESIEPTLCNSIISLNNGDIITSESHTHLIRRGGYWRFLKAIEIWADDFIYKDGKIIEVKSAEWTQEEMTVYKLIMKSPNHLFVVNGYLTHNSKL